MCFKTKSTRLLLQQLQQLPQHVIEQSFYESQKRSNFNDDRKNVNKHFIAIKLVGPEQPVQYANISFPP